MILRKPVISVIVPVYNAELYLESLLQSILRQTFEQFELLLIDDGSTDRSGSICDEYKLTDNRIKVIHKRNEGQGNARNLGLDLAQGEWIFFADDDDIVEKDALEELLRIANEENSDLVVAGYYGYNFTGVVRWNEIPKGVETNTGKAHIVNDCSGVPWSMVWGKLYKRKIWEHIRFSDSSRYYEDSWIMPSIYIESLRMTTYPRAVYHYYERIGSGIHQNQNDDAHVDARIKLYEHLFELYSKEKIINEAYKQAFYMITTVNSIHNNYHLKKRWHKKAVLMSLKSLTMNGLGFNKKIRLLKRVLKGFI